MKKSISLSAAFLILLMTGCSGKKHVSVKDLEVEHLKNPLCIDIQNPRFSWKISSSSNNISQNAWQVCVADSPDKLRSEKELSWNSQRVENSNSIGIEYSGTPLKSNSDYYWKVKIWTNKGEAESEAGSFSTAFMTPFEWKASWIGLDSLTNPEDSLGNQTRLAARYLRKEFDIAKPVKRARLFISGLGLYECFINGEKVSSDVFAPTYTDYDKRVSYNVYDVAKMLAEKKNTIGIMLGNGRYVPIQTWRFRNFGFPKLLMKLIIEFEDGETSEIESDSSWKIYARGPVIDNNEYDGEIYNANFEIPGWNKNGYDDSGWMNAREVAVPKGILVAQLNPNMAVMEEIKPASVRQVKPGVYLLDMGQNMVGWLKISLEGEKDKPVKLRFAERIYEDGMINTENLRAAKSRCIYIPASDGPFSWEPVFSYYGFRYAEITGLEKMPDVAAFTGKVIYDRMETLGNFECSNPILNQIYKNAYWGIRGNYRSGPTDCPQRDERMHWMGDRSMECFGESFIFDNHLLYAKWARDISDAQLKSGCLPDIAPYHSFLPEKQDTYGSDNVTWPSTFIFVTDMLYERFGDTRPVAEHYDAMVKWVNYMTENYLKNNILVKDQYGDWCVPPESPELILTKDPNRITDGAILSTTYFYHILNTMAKFAGISGHPEAVQGYLTRAENIRKAYNEKFFNTETAKYGNNTATANILSLYLGLVPEGFERRVMQNIDDKIMKENNGHIATGLVGTQFLMRCLTKYGNQDLAFRLATNTTFPSWGYMVENGATTVWELWNGNTADPAMNSHNHVMLLGDLIVWYYEYLAGIKSDPESTGFKKIIMHPVFYRELDHVKANYQSPYGTINSEWTRTDKGITWNICIPCNSSAVIKIPVASVKQITINGNTVDSTEGCSVLSGKENMVTLQAGSGIYKLEF